MSNITKAIAALGVVAGLGVAALPLSSYAAQSQPVKVVAEIDSTLSVTAADTVVNLGSVLTNGDIKDGSTTVTVTSNAANGYKLVINDVDTDTSMTSADAPATTTGLAASIEANDLSGASGWAFKGGKIANWTAVPASTADGAELVNSAEDGSTTATNDTVTVTFGVKADNSIANGTYEDTVIFTATANEAPAAP